MQKGTLFKALVGKYADLRGKDAKTIAAMGGMGQSKLYDRMKHPEDLTVKELNDICKGLAWRTEDKIDLIENLFRLDLRRDRR